MSKYGLSCHRRGRPVRSWPDLDEAFQNIASGIRAVAEEMAGRP
jgi:hypothetical protein